MWKNIIVSKKKKMSAVVLTTERQINDVHWDQIMAHAEKGSHTFSRSLGVTVSRLPSSSFCHELGGVHSVAAFLTYQGLLNGIFVSLMGLRREIDSVLRLLE